MAGASFRFVLPEGVAGLVRNAVEGNTDGIRDAITAVVGNTRSIRQNSDGSWPTVTRRDWLDYRWVAWVDPNRPPKVESGARPGDEYVGLADAFVPSGGGVETRTAAFVEDFTGVMDGPAWPAARWATAKTAVGGSVRVVSQAGVLTSGKAGGYDGDDATTVRVVGQQYGDVEVQADVVFGTAVESELRLNARCPNTDMELSDGVSFTLSRQWAGVTVAAGWDYSQVGARPATGWDAGVQYRVRVIIASQATGGTRLRARVWRADTTEPGTWLIDEVTTRALPTVGYLGLEAPGGDAPVANVLTVDNIAVYTRPPTLTPQWWGTWAG